MSAGSRRTPPDPKRNDASPGIGVSTQQSGSTRQSVYNALSCREGLCVSGEELGRSLRVSRVAVSKAVSALRSAGHVVEAAPGRGYRLLGTGHRAGACELSQEAVSRAVSLALPGLPEPIYRGSMGSTNDVAKELARAGAPHGTVVVASQQTAGRGRLGRQWHSPPGGGLWLSLVLRPRLLPLSQAHRLTGAAAIAVLDAIGEGPGADAAGTAVAPAGDHAASACTADSPALSLAVKWPNDLVSRRDDRKVCGILVEVSAEPDAVSWAVIGIGLNVNLAQADFPDLLAPIATSLSTLSGTNWRLLPLLQAIVRRAVIACSELGDDQVWQSILLRLAQESCILGRNVVLTGPSGASIAGLAEGLDADGALLLRLPDGGGHRAMVGEVSLRSAGTGGGGC